MKHYFIKFSYLNITYTTVINANFEDETSKQVHLYFYAKCLIVLIEAGMFKNEQDSKLGDIMPYIDILMIQPL